jgi:hypothetical protein
MLIVNIIFKDKEIKWKFSESPPNMYDLCKFIKTQYPDSLGAVYIDN